MAKRSYLYSINVLPFPYIRRRNCQISDLSEYNGKIPLVHKILISANPRKCRSLIWKNSKVIALVGEYEGGVAKLIDFLNRISHPEIIPIREKAIQFLDSTVNKNEYFLLECGEIFKSSDDPLEEQNDRLLSEIENIDRGIAKALQDLSSKSVSTVEDLYEFGLGHWANMLYIHLGNR